MIQAVGQLTYIRPFVPEWDVTWLAVNSLTLVAGAMILIHVRPTRIHFSASNSMANHFSTAVDPVEGKVP